MQIDIVESDIRALINKVVPERGLYLVDVLNKDILCVVDSPWDGSSITGSVPCLDIIRRKIDRLDGVC